MFNEIKDFAAPELDVYARTSEVQLLRYNEGIEVYLDKSLKQFTTVYPAAGNDHSAVKLTISELEQVSEANGWVDVCKETENGSFMV